MENKPLAGLMRVMSGSDNFGWAPLVWADPDI